MAAKKKKASNREVIDTGRDKRYVRRDSAGKFEESDDMGRSLSKDRTKKANRKSKAGQGDKGDRKKANTPESSEKIAFIQPLSNGYNDPKHALGAGLLDVMSV
jgi:hypothetical protein